MATQKRILIWTTPRSLSTVLLRALSQLPDSQVIFEYLLLARFNEIPDFFADQKGDLVALTTETDFTIQSWKDLYERPFPGKSFIIGKEIVATLGDRMEMIPEGYTHAFLMRHPSKSITSYDAALFFFSPEQKASAFKQNQFQSLARVYEHVTQTLGQETVAVLDADDLLAKPAEMLRQFCETTGVPFSKELLHWDQIEDEQPSNWLMPKKFWDNSKKVRIYKTAFESTCFHANKETSSAAKEGDAIKPEIQELIQKALPYYESLYKHRLVVE